MKVLNLYAGIGGNRKLWTDVKVTAVERDIEIAEVYHSLYPKDNIVAVDAHQYLLEHYKEYDFVWSSPPCPTHSVCNNYLNAQGVIRYPDMELYQEIIFLKHFFKGKWCVENVISYYDPLVRPTAELDRHYFWSNFFIAPFEVKRDFNINNARACTRQTPEQDFDNLQKFHKIYLDSKTKNARQMLRNCVYPPLGLHILNESKTGLYQELFT